jgi:hypothetical protein
MYSGAASCRREIVSDNSRDDFPRFRPVDGGCSPYGVIFGLPSHLIEHMALKALQHDAETRFSLEDLFLDDVFDDAGTNAAKLAWVNGWRKLSHIAAKYDGCTTTRNSGVDRPAADQCVCPL